MRRLRREMTPQEKLLWGQLRGRRFEGSKFRKQMWLANYIAEFACAEARLIVEADGSQHADNAEYDSGRERAFARLGWRTLRFWNNEITENLEGVLTVIASALPSPSRAASRPAVPLPYRERGEDGPPAAKPSPSRGEGQPGPRGTAG
ncbi:MAG: endonuclease domain-containing protein [Allosphingosinicella sp.]